MKRTLETLLVEQCAPTLAGVKPASLFRYQPGEERPGKEAVDGLRKELATSGLTLRILKVCGQTGAYMLYLYRAQWLHQILADSSNQAFLQKQGYRLECGIDGILGQLSARLCMEREYPHEIGVFLGYPLEDVVGFIENRGRNYVCCGYWKVYGDPAAALKRFECYRRCTADYKERIRKGIPLARLVVAA
jgi:hypothetical protein